MGHSGALKAILPAREKPHKFFMATGRFLASLGMTASESFFNNLLPVEFTGVTSWIFRFGNLPLQFRKSLYCLSWKSHSRLSDGGAWLLFGY